MDKCVVCGKECAGKCCSGACRARLSRRTVAHAHAEGLISKAHAVKAHAHGKEAHEVQLGSVKPAKSIPKHQPDYNHRRVDTTLAEYLESKEIELAGGPRKYADRTKPERINWGPLMDEPELDANGLKANRATIPGDHDYQGCCVNVSGQWELVNE